MRRKKTGNQSESEIIMKSEVRDPLPTVQPRALQMMEHASGDVRAGAAVTEVYGGMARI